MKPQRLWDKIASKYDKKALGKYKETYQETISISKKYLKPTDMLLDFACGTGITTIEAAKSVRQVMAIDLSGEMIRVAREKATSRGIDNITFKIATIEFKRNDLLKLISINGFRIIEDKNLYHSPPNYFIAARKNEV